MWLYCSLCFMNPLSSCVAERYWLIYWSASILGSMWSRQTGGQMETKGPSPIWSLCATFLCFFYNNHSFSFSFLSAFSAINQCVKDQIKSSRRLNSVFLSSSPQSSVWFNSRSSQFNSSSSMLFRCRLSDSDKGNKNSF